MNTRIQVEHPVTEMITGIDIVQEQIRIAAGEKLRIRQRDIAFRGHAIECRINAEDPYKFTPCPGRIVSYHPPGGPGIRVDTHIYANYVVPSHYDSLIGKVIAYGENRDQAIARMRVALSEMIVEGISTNIPAAPATAHGRELPPRRHQHSLPRAEARRQQGRLTATSWPGSPSTSSCRETASSRCPTPCSRAGRCPSTPPTARRETAAETPIFGEPGATVSPWPARASPHCSRRTPRPRRSCGARWPAAGLDGDVELHAGRVDDADWVRLTQDQFQPIRISDRLWVVPTWHTAPDPTAVNVVLDPGIAFGTGSHPTTRLCLEWLAGGIRGGERVLDYGCGSGILAIAAMKLGAAAAVGVDIDPQAVLAAARNAEQNRVAARFFGPAIEPGGEYDIVVANILSNPLKALAPLLASRVRPGGRLHPLRHSRTAGGGRGGELRRRAPSRARRRARRLGAAHRHAAVSIAE